MAARRGLRRHALRLPPAWNRFHRHRDQERARLRRPDAAVLDLGLSGHARLRRRAARRHLRVRPADHLGKRRRLRVRPSLSAGRHGSLLHPVQPEGPAGTTRWLAREDAERRWARDDQQSRDGVLPAVRGGADRLPRSGRRHDRLRRDRGRRNRMPAPARAGEDRGRPLRRCGPGLLVGLPARDERSETRGSRTSRTAMPCPDSAASSTRVRSEASIVRAHLAVLSHTRAAKPFLAPLRRKLAALEKQIAAAQRGLLRLRADRPQGCRRLRLRRQDAVRRPRERPRGRLTRRAPGGAARRGEGQSPPQPSREHAEEARRREGASSSA